MVVCIPPVANLNHGSQPRLVNIQFVAGAGSRFVVFTQIRIWYQPETFHHGESARDRKYTLDMFSVFTNVIIHGRHLLIHLSISICENIQKTKEVFQSLLIHLFPRCRSVRAPCFIKLPPTQPALDTGDGV